MTSYQLPVTSRKLGWLLTTGYWRLATGDWQLAVDIALLPESCNRGIGTTLLRGLQSEAAAAGKPPFALRATAGRLLRIHVERFNPALRLYERLGFTPIADRGVYLFMELTCRRPK